MSNCSFAASFWSHQKHALRQNSFLGLSVDLIDSSSGINLLNLSKLFIIINYRQSLREVCVNSFLNGNFIVISPATRFRPVHTPLEHLFFWNIVEKDLVCFDNIFLEVVSLIERTRESINQISLGF